MVQRLQIRDGGLVGIGAEQRRAEGDGDHQCGAGLFLGKSFPTLKEVFEEARVKGGGRPRKQSPVSQDVWRFEGVWARPEHLRHPLAHRGGRPRHGAFITAQNISSETKRW